MTLEPKVNAKLTQLCNLACKVNTYFMFRRSVFIFGTKFAYGILITPLDILKDVCDLGVKVQGQILKICLTVHNAGSTFIFIKGVHCHEDGIYN